MGMSTSYLKFITWASRIKAKPFFIPNLYLGYCLFMQISKLINVFKHFYTNRKQCLKSINFYIVIIYLIHHLHAE